MYTGAKTAMAQKTPVGLYQVGDIVTYNRPGDPFYGSQVTIVGLLRRRDVVTAKTGTSLCVDCYKVTNPNPQVIRNIPALPIHLVKKPIRGDIDKVMTWAEGPWQPSNINK